jgi:hypothetical protein
MFCKQKDPFADKVKCEVCKHWIDKVDAQKVKKVWEGRYSTTDDLFYCPEHKRPYDKMFTSLCSIGITYFKTMIVSEDGTPVGYKKIKE